MTTSEAINKLIGTAEAEIGYLEKKSNAQLDDKTANAGTSNYTKYWRDIKPEYQGQPWCAAFVTWCMVQAFGRGTAERLLKHYPYVYCPTMAGLFKMNANPKPGDIVIFYRNGEFAHTGIVTSVNGDYFTTVEGNTSGGSTIIANGGGVCKKGYYNSNLPGTKFCTPDWNILSESEELTMTQYKELKNRLDEMSHNLTNIVNDMDGEIEKLKSKVAERTGHYNYIDENMPDSYKPTIQKLVNTGFMQGDENGNLMLTIDAMRTYTILDRILTAAGVDVSKLRYTG